LKPQVAESLFLSVTVSLDQYLWLQCMPR